MLELSASDPLPFPPERIRIRGSKGALFVHSLGDASPRHLEIDFSMGEAQLDLRGDWVADSQVTLDIGLSDVLLRLPRQAVIEGLETTRVRSFETREIDAPKLSFAVTRGVRGSVKVFE